MTRSGPIALDEGIREPTLARSMASMTALTALSRLTGFVLFVVVAAVLGTGLLANTYQTANTVPNVLYELLVAGVVQAVLVPSLVARLDRGEQREAEHVAGAVLGLAMVALGLLAGLAMAAAPLVARMLFGGGDGATRDAQIRTGTVFLWFFLPQVVLYAAGLVATSVLNARHRFALPAVAPMAGNVVVLAACAIFWQLRDGRSTLTLRPVEIVVLAGGTTLGVVAFCGLPVMAVARSGFRLRPNLDRRHPEVRRLARHGAWAALFLAATQVLLLVVLVLANRVPGGVIAYQLAFQFFLLPHALFALPVLTTLFPTLSRQHHDGDPSAFGATAARGVATIAYLVAPMAALLGALGGPIGRAVLFGEATPRGAALVSGCLAGFAPGLLGYGLFLFASRVSYARGDTRTPALVNLWVVAGGSALMVAGYGLAPDRHRITALAAGHSMAYLIGAAVLVPRSVRHLRPADRPHLVRQLARPVGLAAVLAGVVALAAIAADPHGRVVAVLTIVVLAVGGLAAYVIATWATGGPAPSAFVRALRGSRP